MLAMLNATRHTRTTDICCNGRWMANTKLTTAMVTIWPTTAIQRSWMSCRMFSRPVESSKTCGSISALRARFTADPEPYCTSHHDRKRIPGDRVDEATVVEGDDGEACHGGPRAPMGRPPGTTGGGAPER